MTRIMKTFVAAALLAGGVWSQQAFSQQVVAPSAAAAPATPRAVPSRTPRQYRSYSVNPTRGDVRRDGPHAGDATWRHAGAKPHGHFATGK